VAGGAVLGEGLLAEREIAAGSAVTERSGAFAEPQFSCSSVPLIIDANLYV
jgi:hypothetical protein